MKIFKNSTTAKVVTGFLGLALVAVVAAPAVASAMDAMMMSSSYTFTKTLKMGMSDQEVMNLQTVLNGSADTMVTASGVGSKGMETKYFGGLTKAAVIKFQEKYAADILTPNGLTKGTGLVGASTRAKLNGMGSMSMMYTPGCTSATGFSMTTGQKCMMMSSGHDGMMSMVPGCTSTTGYSPSTGQPCSANVVTTATGTGAVSAMLDTSSAMAGSVIKGASTKVATFKLTNSGSAAVKVTSIKMKRTGISSDSTFRNVYLYNGAMRITDAASVATGNINYSDASGIVTIPAMSSVMLGVMVEVDSSAGTGETLGVMLTEVLTDSGSVSGLPVSGAQQQVVAAPNGIATISYNSTTLPSSSGSIDPTTDYAVWQNTIQIGSRDVLLSSIRFRQTGSVSAGDLKNFRLMVDGVQTGSAVDVVNSNQYVEFNFASPVTLKSGGRTIKLVADVVGGSNKTFAFSIQQSVDAMFWDSQLNVVVAPLFNSGSFQSVNAFSQTVNQGTLTITKTTDSPSGNIVLQGSGVTIGKFTLKAAGERLKIENLKVNATIVTSGLLMQPTAAIRNGALFLNGSQIGSTADIKGSANTSATYTQFNLGSSLIVEPGHDVTLEVRGDIYNTGATTTPSNFTSGDTIVLNVLGGSSNVYKMSSYGYFSNPTAAGNTVTVNSGSMTVSKATAYANQTVVAPQTALKIGEFNVTTGSTEALNLNQFTLGFTGATAHFTSLQDVYVTYGAKSTVIKSTVASTSNTFSVNEVVPAGTTLSVKVYATVNSSVPAASVITATLGVDATSQSSGNTVATVTATGQNITVGAGTLTVAIDASTPIAALAVGNSMPIIASYKFTSSNDAFTIVDLSATTTNSSSIIELVFKDGATELGRQPFNGTSLTKTGLNLLVPANTNKVVTVYASLGSVGTNAGDTGANIQLTLTSVKSRNSNGVEATTAYVNGISGNAMYVYKTKPTITNNALPNGTVLNSGSQTVYAYKVTADVGGTVAWRTIKFNVASSSPSGSFSVGTFNLYDAANQSSVLTNTLCTLSGATVTCTSSTDQEVSGSKDYVLKATVTGSIVTGATISVNIPSSSLAHANPTDVVSAQATTASFVWSDEALTPHTGASLSWNNDNLVKVIPTDSETLTK